MGLIRHSKQVAKAVRVAPDAWAQVLVTCVCAAPAVAEMEAARAGGGTYKCAMTFRFFKGNGCMEVVRVVTNESDPFVQVMIAEDGTDKTVVLFETASKVLVANAQAAGHGKGLDRHFLSERSTTRDTLVSLFGPTARCAACLWPRAEEGVHLVCARKLDGITSPAEMPNEEFAAGILRTVGRLYALY